MKGRCREKLHERIEEVEVQKKLKIAMLGHKRVPSREGGVEIVVEELSVRMAARGHRVTCYNRSGHHISGAEFDSTDAGKEYKGVRLKTVPSVRKKGVSAVVSSFFGSVFAAAAHYDVVHIHAEGPAAFCWIPKMLGKKVVVTVHGLDWKREKWQGGFGSKYIHFGEKMAVKWADEIIVLSEGLQAYFMNTYGRETRFIPNGVSKPEAAEIREIDKKFGLKKEEYILYLGRIVPEKGGHYLIEAWREIRSSKKLVIAGGTSDTDEYVMRLKKLAEGDERIIFTGFVQGRLLEELYSNSYLFVLPSDLEGMPLSLLEAMSYGNCCLVSDIDECSHVIGDAGIVFKKADVKDLRDKLQSCIDEPEKVKRYKEGAAGYICRKYDWKEVMEETFEVYRSESAQKGNFKFEKGYR